MKVATWNINNVVKRLDLVLAWLDRTKPDVVALQELKTPTASFPAQAFQDAGYTATVVGQRTWNGVALLSRGTEPLLVTRVLAGDPADKEARYVEAAISGVLFACLYLPNGNPQPGPKFDYKLKWFGRMRRRAEELMATGQPVVLLGDWNVVPTDADIYKPDTWRDNALLQPQPRQAFAEILAQGWTDALKSVHPADTPFTFWHYRRQRWERNAGLRIDHILVSAALAVSDAGVDREERGKDNASDHAPVWAEIGPKVKSPARGRAKGPAKQPVTSAALSDVAIDQGAAIEGPLSRYNAKRNFKKTAEPAGAVADRTSQNTEPLQFVVQKHWASRLHYDFRLELDGVMLSWAVPKGPSCDPAIQQMAIHVEDHPLAYNTFEGSIPKGEYGAGTVIVWDRGTWEPVNDPREGLKAGKVIFKLHGQKLAGLWELVRISKPGAQKQDQWLLFKKRGDVWARPSSDYDVITALPDSVIAKPLGLVEERQAKQAVRGNGVATAPDLGNARKSALPKALAPQLATLATAPPAAGDWIVENKFDGYRLLARIERGTVQLFTRAGNDWTHKMRDLAGAVAALDIDAAWLDGEIVVMGDKGLPDFNRLQKAMDSSRSAGIQFFVFDVPFLGGNDLRDVPLADRRAALQQLLAGRSGDRVRLSEAFDATPAQMLEAACRLGLEGVMAKRADAPYVCARSDTWLKLKCQQRQEFVVVGFTDRANAKGEVGSLLLGYHENSTLRSAGSVGTGWNATEGAEMYRRLTKLLSGTPTVDPASVVPGRWSKRAPGSERWVRPEMIVEVAFGEWTPDGHVRHAVWQGIRQDKPARAITREVATVIQPAEASGSSVRAIKITNPDRIIDPSTGLKKINLVRYYESIADWLLPHLKGRPVSLVRAPDGITGEQFFQKHPETRMPGLLELDPALWPGHTALLGIDSVDALQAAAQMNVIEFHTWNSTTQRMDQPDRMIFDLDPGEGVTWAQLQEAAMLMRTLLTELGLDSWLKTSGGKGLHVVVPLAPKLDYDVVKGFSQAAVQHMARTIPQRFVAKSGGANRVGKIFIDYLRNGHAQTTAAAFSARARPGMGVSMPVGWDDLASLKGGAHWNISTVREYVSLRQQDPWDGYWKSKQSLTLAMKALGYVLKR